MYDLTHYSFYSTLILVIFISASYFSYPIILFYLSLFPLVSNGNRREPAEISFHSVTFQAQTSTNTGDGFILLVIFNSSKEIENSYLLLYY